MSAVTYELLYFKNACARSESIKAVFTLAGVDFKLSLYDFEGDWASIKSETPLGQVPVLRVHDAATDAVVVQLSDSQAIERFLAKRFGVLNIDADDDVALAQLTARRNDLESVLYSFWDIYFSPKELNESPALISVYNSAAENLVLFHEKLLAANHGGNGHYFGTKITVADIALTHLVLYTRSAGHGAPFAPEKAPLINKVADAVVNSAELSDFYKGFAKRLAEYKF
ncbi:hypothetical protein GQ42DRAFT_156242 [Ramicandelaber brevisporus]|nr:hypothetical protein GQ42DRAFT_156242 [Ramicandelaber brevisporus]